MNLHVSHVVAIIGPPGSGKDTVVKNGVEGTSYFHFSFSEALRYACEGNSHIEEQVQRAMREGRLVNHHLVSIAFNQYLHEKVPGGSNVVFTGFPRNAEQVDVLFETFAGKAYIITVIVLQVSDEICLERMSGRGRQDDDIAQTRLEEYRSLLSSILERVESELRLNDKLVFVDASKSPQEVLSDVLTEISQRELTLQ